MLAEYLMAVFRSEVVDIGACGCRYATVRQGPGTDWEGQDAHQLGATHLEKLTRHGDVAHAAEKLDCPHVVRRAIDVKFICATRTE